MTKSLCWQWVHTDNRIKVNLLVSIYVETPIPTPCLSGFSFLRLFHQIQPLAFSKLGGLSHL